MEPLPIGQQLALFLLLPLVGACLWWLFSRGAANMLEGGNASERTRGWLNKGFFVVLVGAYLVMFGIKIYSIFLR
jgi:hypothetical protein